MLKMNRIVRDEIIQSKDLTRESNPEILIILPSLLSKKHELFIWLVRKKSINLVRVLSHSFLFVFLFVVVVAND